MEISGHHPGNLVELEAPVSIIGLISKFLGYYPIKPPKIHGKQLG